jgi:hypothetical protein
MDDYHYTFMDTDGRTGANLTLYPSSDEVACELAKELLSKSKFASLELRKGPGADLIYHIGKTDVEGPSHRGGGRVTMKVGARRR